MRPDLPAEAVDFGESARRAFQQLGGVDAARNAEADPSIRAARVADTLAALGATDLDPRQDLDTASAAAELCRVAGRVVLPYPVVGVLLRQADDTPFAVVAGGRNRVDHGDLFARWTVCTIDGPPRSVTGPVARLGTRLGPFVGDLAPGPEAPARRGDVALALTLGAWQILGAVERAVELAVEHVSGRIQFGQPISAFQAVQFQLADASLGVDGLRELCRFTLWRLGADPASGLTDALALRVHALDVARDVLRTTQQLHGASGVCDEYDISVICRHVQPFLRLPFGSEETVTALVAGIAETGFESLFPQGLFAGGSR